MITTIAIVLFIVLCPCISYIIVKRKIIPWTGGVMLVKEDGGFIPVDFSEYRCVIGDAAITGLFLPGAHAHSMPDISIRAKLDIYYSGRIEKDGGVYVMFNQPIKNQCNFLLDVVSAYPWKGKQIKDSPRDDGYYKHVDIRPQSMSH